MTERPLGSSTPLSGGERVRPVASLLIANRGEIAVRIAATCRRLGVRSIAVYSDADANALHVRAADEAVRIGAAPARDSYLRIDALVDAARRTGADALHPGYGFLAENPALAEACAEAGVTFVGPPAAVIRTMGSKIEAKRLAASVGVPVIPGGGGEDQSDDVLVAVGRSLGVPLLVKASAGGGGKGMRRVNDLGDLPAALAAARREAGAAFGDPALLLERYIERPRHVEIQILGDVFGQVVHLHERECSVQRRHQKLVEETPSTALSADLRRAMGQAAVALARAIGYVSAGTVEFVLGPDGAFYFLEVNTRLQVEHPVTETVFGIDLVEEQLRIAEGRPLRFSSQDDVHPQGAAVEVRICAEDVGRGFLPSTGTVADWWLPPHLEGVRLDAGVEGGAVVGVEYDPLLAKLIAWGEDRATAHRRLTRALELLSPLGLKTNRDALLRIIHLPEYIAGQLDTHLIERCADAVAAEAPSSADARAAALVAVAAAWADNPPAPGFPDVVPRGWRNNLFRRAVTRFCSGGLELSVEHAAGKARNALIAWVDGAGEATELVVERREGAALDLRIGGHRRSFRAIAAHGRWWVRLARAVVCLDVAPRFPEADVRPAGGSCASPMPGRLVRLEVQVGDEVQVGQRLAVVEAMKMEHVVTAPDMGVVEELFAMEGDQVEADQPLLRLARRSEE